MAFFCRCRGAAYPRLEVRHQASGLNSHFAGGDTFADYVLRTREMLARAHAGTTRSDLENIVDGNAPFELKPSTDAPRGISKPYRRGVLLTHGLSDSPYFMRHLAAFFRENGFRVMAILLPGHGTQPGDLLDVHWQEWARAIEFGADKLAEEVDEVYLAGYSAGAALSINHSLIDSRVRGMFLFSPALEISQRAALAYWHTLYSWLMPSAKWVELKPDLDIFKYESFPKNAAVQMYLLTKLVAARIKGHGLHIPTFVAASLDDATVHASATLEFISRTKHPASKLVLYATESAVLSPEVPLDKIERVNSTFPEQRIFSSAHTAIVMPPEDAHYGEAGEYVNCLHYHPQDMDKYQACLDKSNAAFQGEVTSGNLGKGLLRRLMYNPNYAALKDSMRRFIEQLPA